MLKLIVSILLMVSFSQASAKCINGNKGLVKLSPIAVANPDSSKHLDGGSVRADVKFQYAELLYQRLYGEDKLAVNGTTISKALKTSVAESKYRDVALDLLGSQGWELSVAVTRELNSGFEILFYLKKKID